MPSNKRLATPPSSWWRCGWLLLVNLLLFASQHEHQASALDIGSVVSPWLGHGFNPGSRGGVGTDVLLNGPQGCAYDPASNRFITTSGSATIFATRLNQPTVNNVSQMTSTHTNLLDLAFNPLSTTAGIIIINREVIAGIDLVTGAKTALLGRASFTGFMRDSGAPYYGENARFYGLMAITRYNAGDRYYVVEDGGDRVTRLETNGTGVPLLAWTVAGDNSRIDGRAGDQDGVGSDARFDDLRGVTVVEATEDVFVTDISNRNIRRVVPNTRRVSTFASLNNPFAIVASADSNFIFASSMRQVYRYDIESSDRVTVINAPSTDSWLSNDVSDAATVRRVYGMCVSPDGSHLYITGTHAVAQVRLPTRTPELTRSPSQSLPATLTRELTVTAPLTATPSAVSTISREATLSRMPTVTVPLLPVERTPSRVLTVTPPAAAPAVTRTAPRTATSSPSLSTVPPLPSVTAAPTATPALPEQQPEYEPPEVPVGQQSGQGAVIVAAGGGGLGGASPGWSTHAARNALLGQLTHCPKPLDGDEQLDPVVNPTQLSLGDEETRQYLGALVADSGIVLGTVVLQMLAGVVVFCIRQGSQRNEEDPTDANNAGNEPYGEDDPEQQQPIGDEGDDDEVISQLRDHRATRATRQASGRTFRGSLLLAKLPRANYIWFLLFLQPITQCALVVVGQSGRALHYAFGFLGFVLAQAASCTMLFNITGERMRAVYVCRPWAVGPDEQHRAELPATVDPDERDLDYADVPPNVLVSLFTPRGDWFPRDTSDVRARLQHSTFKPLYGPFRGGGAQLFIVAEVAMATGFGVAASVFPSTRGECQIQMAAIFAMALAYLVAAVALRPFAVPIDNIALVLLAVLEALSALCLMVMVFAEEGSGTADGASDASEQISTVATWLVFLIVMKDCGVAIGRAVLKHRQEKQRQELQLKAAAGGAEGEDFAATNPITGADGFGVDDEGEGNTPDTAWEEYFAASATQRVAVALAAPSYAWQATSGDGRLSIEVVLDAGGDGVALEWRLADEADDDQQQQHASDYSRQTVWYDPGSGAYYDGATACWCDVSVEPWQLVDAVADREQDD